MTGTRHRLLLVLGVLTLASCTVFNPKRHEAPRDPDAEAAAIRQTWHQVRRGAKEAEDGGRVVVEERLLDRAESVALEYPKHEGILMLCAGLSYSLDRPERARAFLDSLLDADPTHAEAAALRARIAIEQGRVPYATGLLERTIELRPDSSDLRETLASALYLSDRMAEAAHALDAAERLGAPAFRVAYNRGLIAEATGRPGAAAEFYRASLAARPGWPPAQQRLAGLAAVPRGRR